MSSYPVQKVIGCFIFVFVNRFSYKYGTPCVALKINKIYGWKPSPFLNKVFPPGFPDGLKENYEHGRVYISCEGEVR